MRVTVEDVQRHVTAGQFDTTAAGKRLVGVDLRLTNVSDTQYDDSPSNGSTLILDDDTQADATITTGGSCDLSVDVKIAPGDSRRVCIPFEVSSKRHAKTFQFTLDSGFGDQAGEWSLRN